MRTDLRRRAGALLVLVALMSQLVFPATPSAGDAVSDKRAEAERIARQLEQQGRQVSILAEDYDEARVRIEALDRELTSAREQVARTDARAGAIRVRLKQQAVASYVRGGSTQALAMLAGTRTTEDFAVRSQYVRTLTSGAADVLDELRAVRLALDEQRGRLDTAQSEAHAAAVLAETKRREAMAAEAAQRKTLQLVQGELSSLVEEERRRRAEEEARRAEAELAARKAKAEAAAREAAAKEAATAAAAAAAAAKKVTTTTAKAPTAPTAGSVLSPVVTPRPTSTTTTTAAPRTTTTTSPSTSGGTTSGAVTSGPPVAGADAAIAEAKRQIGKPYEWGGSGPDTFDCSGLTSWAWRAGGKSLPHSSRAQWTATSRVDIDNIKPGDLLFYGEPIHHVGLYIGDGQMIEAPETGKNVRYGSIFRSDYVGAGRLN